MIHLTDEEKAYMQQMDSWFKEQDARETQIKVTIETSRTIVEENELQLAWHKKRVDAAMKEYAEWLRSKGGGEEE